MIATWFEDIQNFSHDVDDPNSKTGNLIKEYYLLYPVDSIFQQLKKESFKAAVVYNDLQLSLYNYKKPENRTVLNFIKLDQKVISYNIGILLPAQKIYLHSTMKKKINQLIEAGFFNHWIDSYLSHRSVQVIETEDVKVVLTMDHLSVGFILWFAVLLFASVAFIAELSRIFIPFFIHGMFFWNVLRYFYKFNRNH